MVGHSPIRLTIPVVREAEAHATPIHAAIRTWDALKDGRSAAPAVCARRHPLTAARGLPLDADTVVVAGLAARGRARVVDADVVLRAAHLARAEVAAGLVAVAAVLDLEGGYGR
ncbi:hypothetical protein PspLS_05106 [Pyricularia sp. CBS 133598]|nr:hypothetical protein PspLS_05106 [Pyricularia sp. CBS 133598]